MRKLDLTYEYKIKVLVTDLKDKFLNPEQAIVLYTFGESKNKTISIQLKDIQITLDFLELLEILGEKLCLK